MSSHPVYLDFPAGTIMLIPSAISINSGYLSSLVIDAFVRPYKNSCYEISVHAECLMAEKVNPVVIEEIIENSQNEVSINVLKQVFGDKTQPFKLIVHSFFNDNWTFHSLTSLEIHMKPFIQTIGKGILPDLSFYLSAQSSPTLFSSEDSTPQSIQSIKPIQPIQPMSRPRTSFLDID